MNLLSCFTKYVVVFSKHCVAFAVVGHRTVQLPDVEKNNKTTNMIIDYLASTDMYQCETISKCVQFLGSMCRH